MNRPTEQQVDVVVVGAGPVGLLTAIELTLGGVHALVLERLGAASTATKALQIGPLGIEALQRRGMAAAISAAEERALAAVKKFMEQNGEQNGKPNGTDLRGGGPKFIGHFAGLTLIRADAQKEPERRAHPVGLNLAKVDILANSAGNVMRWEAGLRWAAGCAYPG